MANYGTPKNRPGLARPSFSYSTSGASPSPSNFRESTAVNRKASYQALTGQANGNPKTPSNKMDSELSIGDQVDVPGDMFGVVKFVGTVRGKNGRFVGVELDRDFAARGKNDGDVDGIHYFHTTVPGAGIFLPVHRAEKRYSPGMSFDSSPTGPDTPTYSTVNGRPINKTQDTQTPPTPAVPHRFAQTIGPGARPPSPQFKPKRPSLPRPESPFRKPAPNLAPTPASAARNLSQSVRGGRPGVTPSKSNFKSSTTVRPSISGTGQTPRPYSRSSSRLGNRNDGIQEEERTPVGSAITSNSRTTSQGSIPSFSQPLRSPSRLGSAGGHDQEIHRLRAQLQERDRRLEEQAASLAEMEQSVKELSAIIPQDSSDGEDYQTAAQLRQALREKNEKISLLTAEFDAHRADFRSTLDSLEMASTETERVYEEQKRDLLAQLAEMQNEGQRASASAASQDDFDQVASQLKQLEELVAELEEGLEESRRGEAEARGEVEFLRGEVERGRSELKRERDKASAKGSEGFGVSSSKELAQKDDEIRGLKAIIHGLSSQPTTPSTGGGANGVLEDAGEVKKLKAELEDSHREKESLEQELEKLRREKAATNGSAQHVRNESEMTAKGTGSSQRARAETIKGTFAERARRSLEKPLPSSRNDYDDSASGNAAGGVFCEMCESAEHDTLDCTKLQSNGKAYSPGKENEHHVVNGNGVKANAKVVEEDKWCALCEKDGHLAFDCPEEQY